MTDIHDRYHESNHDPDLYDWRNAPSEWDKQRQRWDSQQPPSRFWAMWIGMITAVAWVGLTLTWWVF